MPFLNRSKIDTDDGTNPTVQKDDTVIIRLQGIKSRFPKIPDNPKIRIISSSLLVVFLLFSLSVGFYLVQNKELIFKKAAIPGFPDCVLSARLANYPQYSGQLYIQPDSQNQDGDNWRTNWRVWGAPPGRQFKAEVKIHRCRNMPPDPSGYDQCNLANPDTKIIEFTADASGNANFTVNQSVDCCERDQADLTKITVITPEREVEIPWGSSFFLRQAWSDSCSAPTSTPTHTPTPSPTPTPQCNSSCTVGQTGTCPSSLICSPDTAGATSGPGHCRNSQCPTRTNCICITSTPSPTLTATPTQTPTLTPTVTPSPTLTATPTLTPTPNPDCNSSCTVGQTGTCPSSLICSPDTAGATSGPGHCRNSQCTSQTNCTCPTPTSTPSPTDGPTNTPTNSPPPTTRTPTPTLRPTATPFELPVVGSESTTELAISGIVISVLGVFLLLP